jgi:hypothetical protein
MRSYNKEEGALDFDRIKQFCLWNIFRHDTPKISIDLNLPYSLFFIGVEVTPVH